MSAMIRILQTMVSICLLCCTAAAWGNTSLSRPNVVFILVDDLGWSDVGYQGSRGYSTPQIDRLAESGTIFSNFYAAGPVCSPTRASILTGMNPARLGITTYLLEPRRDPAHVTTALPADALTLGELFEQHGYATGYFGKWHLGYRHEDWAAQHGFGTARGGMDLPWAWRLAHPQLTPPILKEHTRFFSPYHLTFLKNGPDGEYLTDRLTDETIQFIASNRDKPFLAFLSYHTVHTPLQAKPEKIQAMRDRLERLQLVDKAPSKTRAPKVFQNNPHYAAMVGHLDDNVGRLLRAIDRLRLQGNTIVVFTSDNGGKGSVTSNLPLRGAKHNLYEGGIRVPTIVRLPLRANPVPRVDTPLLSDDFLPTLAALAGIRDSRLQTCDGVNFSPRCTDSQTSVENAETLAAPRQLFWHYPHLRHEGAVREGPWKLLLRYKNQPDELYHLERDPGETVDLAGTHAEIVEKLRAAHLAWTERVGAKFADSPDR